MFLKNNSSRPISLASGLADGSVHPLIPGSNEISKDLWDKVKENPVVKALLKEKTLEVVSLKGDDKGEKDFKELSSKEATALVAETLDVEKLREWLESETRAPIKKAIEAKLEEIDKAGQTPGSQE